MCNCDEKPIHQCQCGGVFDDQHALFRHIGASNNYDVLDRLAAAGDMDTYRARLHGNSSYSRPYTEAERFAAEREVERLQDQRLLHPRQRA